MKQIACAILATGLVSVATPAAAQNMPCANEANIRSPRTSEMVVIDLHNIGTKDATLYWIDFQGIRKQYAVIAPGAKLRQETYLGHVWVLTRGNDCIKMFGAPKYDGPWPFPFSVDGPPE